MTTSSPARPDDADGTGPAQAAGPGAGVATPTRRELLGSTDRDDLESTAVRRQRLLGLLDQTPHDDAAAGADVTRADGRSGAADGAEPPGAPAPNLRARWLEDPDPADVALAGAERARPRSRTAAHWWGLSLSVVLAPVGWFLLTDAGVRLGAASGTIGPVALAELGLGLVVAAVVILTARWSSPGVVVVGAVAFLAGALFLAFPAQAGDLLDPALDELRGRGRLGDNLARSVATDLTTGRLAASGLFLVLLGAVSHGARRQGRVEERTRRELARRDVPGGAARHGAR
ncbi:hypothetical protein [Georgenia yuyongxinii]